MKKYFSVMVTMILLFSCMTVYAADGDISGNNEAYTSSDGVFGYRLDEADRAHIISFTDSSAVSCRIPAEIDGHRVAEICKNAFENCSALKHVTVSAKSFDVAGNAFSGCSALESFSTNGFVQLFTKAFANCPSLRSVALKNTETGGTAFENAFYNCKSLTRVTAASCFVPYDNSIGFCGTKTKVRDFVMKILPDDEDFGTNDNVFNYCKRNGFKSVVLLDRASFAEGLEKYAIDSGIETTLRFNGKTLGTWKTSDNSTAAITKSGKLTTLGKGNVKISVKADGKTYSKYFRVKNSPILSEVKVDALKPSDLNKTYSLKLKKGEKSQHLTILYKAASIDNSYIADKKGIAKITGNKSSDKFRVKALKKGATILRLKVNGVKIIKIKVTV